MADGSLHQDVGHLEGKLESLEASVSNLTSKVEQLTAVLNQAKGAKYVIFTIPAIVGAVASILAFFGMRMTWGN